jgi:hypothetical protein
VTGRRSTDVDWHHWVLPALLAVAWLLLWLTGRRVRLWFLPIAVALSILCVPAGMIAGSAQTSGASCGPNELCFSMHEVDWWFNGLFGFVTCAVLAILTLVVELVMTIVRRTSDGPTAG